MEIILEPPKLQRFKWWSYFPKHQNIKPTHYNREYVQIIIPAHNELTTCLSLSDDVEDILRAGYNPYYYEILNGVLIYKFDDVGMKIVVCIRGGQVELHGFDLKCDAHYEYDCNVILFSDPVLGTIVSKKFKEYDAVNEVKDKNDASQ